MSTDTYYGAARLFAEQYTTSRATIDDENNLEVAYKLLNGCDWVNNASTIELKLNRSVVHASMGYLSKNSRQLQTDFCTSHVEIFYYPQNLNFDQLKIDTGTDLLSAARSNPFEVLKAHKRKVEEMLKPLVHRMLSKAYRTCSLDFTLFEKFRDKNPSINLATLINAITLVMVSSSLHLKAILIAIPVIKAPPIATDEAVQMDLPEKSTLNDGNVAVVGLPTASTYDNIRLFAFSDGKCRQISADGNDLVDSDMSPSIEEVAAQEAHKEALRLLSFLARAARFNSIAERVVPA